MEWWSDRNPITPTLQHSKEGQPVSSHSLICGVESGILSLAGCANTSFPIRLPQFVCPLWHRRLGSSEADELGQANYAFQIRLAGVWCLRATSSTERVEKPLHSSLSAPRRNPRGRLAAEPPRLTEADLLGQNAKKRCWKLQ